MNVAHFYHCYCAGAWQQPLSEHLYALDAAEFDGPITVGLVGSKPDRQQVRSIVAAVYSHAKFIEAASGFEQVTLRPAHEHAKRHDGAILYAHSKGAAHVSEFQNPWRQAMTLHVVSRWREHVQILEGPWVDAIGCHWLIPECWDRRDPWDAPLFAGNFWIARCDYLAKLPTVGVANRGQAETWLGTGRPSVVDLIPGKPDPQTDIPPLQVGRLQVHVGDRLQPDLS